MHRRLYRSTESKVIAGVCGGIAEYFNIDPTIVRILWVLAAIWGGAGIIVYIIAIIIMPISTATSNNYNSRVETSDDPSEGANGGGTVKKEKPVTVEPGKAASSFGIILIILGLLFLLGQFGIFYWLRFEFIVAAVFIIIGVLIIYKGRRG